MSPHDLDLITSLYDYEDGYVSSYSASHDEELDSSEREEEVDPFTYYSTKYFTFTRGTYDLMLKDLSGQDP